MRYLPSSLSLLGTVLFLTGCGFNVDKSASVTPLATGMHGKAMGGQQPVANSTVTVYGVSSAGSVPLQSTTTDASGNFEFNTTPANSYSCGDILASAVPAAQTKTSAPAPRRSAVSPKIPIKGWNTASSARPAVLPDTTQTYTIIVARGGNPGGGNNSSIYLAAGLGKCIDGQSETVEINEVTTVVFATALANFLIKGDAPSDMDSLNAFDIADTNTFQTIIDLPTGTVKPNTVSSTGGTSITIDSAKIYSFANTIASCVNSADEVSDDTRAATPDATPTPSSACQTLFADSTVTVDGTPMVPTDTLTAAAYIAYQPFSSVTTLYQLAGSKPPFSGLSTAPNDWTIGVSYSTPAMGLGIFPTANGLPTSSTIDIDSSGRVWFPSNKSGAAGIGYFDPTENAFNGPFGGTLLADPQYLALDDASQVAWVTDGALPSVVGIDTSLGSEGVLRGSYLIEDIYNGSEPTSTGPLFMNSDGSVVFVYNASNGYNQQYVLSLTEGEITAFSNFTLEPTGLTLNTATGSDPDDPTAPVGVAATSGLMDCLLETSSDTDGNADVIVKAGTCASGGAATGLYDSTSNVQESVIALPVLNSLCSFLDAACSAVPEYLQGPQGVAFDGRNELWFANSANGSIFSVDQSYSSSGGSSFPFFSDRPYLHGAGYGGTMIKPIGIAVDRAGNVWTSNATCASTTDTTCVYTLSEVLGIGYSTITPLSGQAARLQGNEPSLSSIPQPLFTHAPASIPHHSSTGTRFLLNR